MWRRPKLGKRLPNNGEISECVPSTFTFVSLHVPLTQILCYRRHPDLLDPHILRSLSNVKIVSVHAGCAGCHVIALDVEGQAWLFGRNTSSALGVSGVDVISENAPWKLRAQDLGAAAGTKFVHAACGRAHSILVGSDGRVWTAGVNLLGQVSSRLLKFGYLSIRGPDGRTSYMGRKNVVGCDGRLRLFISYCVFSRG